MEGPQAPCFIDRPRRPTVHQNVKPMTSDDHPLLRIETPAAQDLAGIAGVVNDLSFAVDAVARLLAMPEKTRDDITLTRALWSSALIAYMRCFSPGVRYSLKPTIFSTVPGADAAHQFFSDLRNKHVAHPVNAFEDCGVGLLVDPGTAQVLHAGELLLFQLTPGEQNLKVFQSLTKHALEWAEAERQRLRTVVIAEGRKLSEQELRNLDPLRLTPPVSATKVRRGARSN